MIYLTLLAILNFVENKIPECYHLVSGTLNYEKVYTNTQLAENFDYFDAVCENGKRKNKKVIDFVEMKYTNKEGTDSISMQVFKFKKQFFAECMLNAARLHAQPGTNQRTIKIDNQEFLIGTPSEERKNVVGPTFFTVVKNGIYIRIFTTVPSNSDGLGSLDINVIGFLRQFFNKVETCLNEN